VSTLLAALIACESGTAGAADVHAALLSGEVLVPLAEPPAGAATEFVAVETADGRAAVAAFSDERTLALWGDPPAHASVRAVELLRFVAAKGVSAVVLDPAGPVRATLQDGELAALAAGRVPSERDLTAVPAPLPETNIEVGPPELPVEEHVLTALRTALADVPAIRTAWLLEGARSGLRRSLLVVVEGDDEDALMAGLPSVAEAVAPAVGAVATLRFTIARPGARLDALRAETEPVYARP
jgi:type III secretion system (T3SS) SseB-like protein